MGEVVSEFLRAAYPAVHRLATYAIVGRAVSTGIAPDETASLTSPAKANAPPQIRAT
ncbi:hypothetical protein HYPGJ_30717 [Hyphomicrobium sp. GJ21]|nr:hypothetical protein HYPGJ_30717 [Hyphomicrobium sp. GJ21]